MTAAADIDRLLDRVPLLADRTSVEPLVGGLTNTNLRVVTPGGDHVVRLSGDGEERLLIDRDAEHANTVRAHEAGVGAEVLGYHPDLHLLVIGYLPGRTLVDDDFADAGVLARAADACRRLHAGPRFVGEFDMFARQRHYAAVVATEGFRVPPGYHDHADAWAAVERALGPRSGWTTAPCNNDLLAGNFIDDGERVFLIDYEYAGNNDPCFELGNTSTECGFSAERTEAYVAAYLGVGVEQVDPGFLARVRLQTLCSQYGWALWGCIQAGARGAGGDGGAGAGFDYYAWGEERYEKAARTFGWAGFEPLLATVAGSRMMPS